MRCSNRNCFHPRNVRGCKQMIGHTLELISILAELFGDDVWSNPLMEEGLTETLPAHRIIHLNCITNLERCRVEPPVCSITLAWSPLDVAELWGKTRISAIQGSEWANSG